MYKKPIPEMSMEEQVNARIEDEKLARENKKKKDLEERREKITAEKKKKAAVAPPIQPSGETISDEDIQIYLDENSIGDARLFSRLYRNKFIYVVNWELWLFWAGHHWEEDFFNQKYQAIRKVWEIYQDFADRKKAEANEETDKDRQRYLQKLADTAYQRVKNLTRPNGQEQLLESCKRIENPLLAKPEQFDCNPFLKACPNGVINLKDGRLMPGRPEDYILKALPTPYDPSLFDVPDPCPQTMDYLLSSMGETRGDKEVVDFIWRLLGYGLITKRTDHVFVIFWGEHGRNGKDTLIKLVTKVMGDELSGDVNVDMFLQTGAPRSSSSSSPDILELRGMCIAWINEAEEHQRFDLAKLKKLTGGGKISARGNYEKKSTKWEQTHLPIMTTNELPKAKADDAAFWSRAIIVKWPFSFVPEPKEPHERPEIKNLDAKLQEESEVRGVLARMVKGAVEYLKNGFDLNVPEKVKAWAREQRLKFDDLAQFLEEWCVREPYQENPKDYQLKVRANELYDAFCLWYAENRDKRYSISTRRFGELLNKKGIPSMKSNGTWRLGLTLTAVARERVENHARS